MSRELKFRIVTEAEMTAIARANAQLSKFATTVGVDFNRLSQIVRSSGGDCDKVCQEIDGMAPLPF
ncbi:MAG: hypothetical protein IJR99_01255 [Kiritimatiellae bacterium]|nr:hypothetical protein [Kiritimatiellia bacterium]